MLRRPRGLRRRWLLFRRRARLLRSKLRGRELGSRSCRFICSMGSSLPAASQPDVILPGNYVPDACKGCVIVHGSHPRIIESGPAETDPFFWDPESKVFTVSNSHRYPRFAYLTIAGVDVLDRDGQPFESGTMRAEDGDVGQATTFVLTVAPRTRFRLGYVDAGEPLAKIDALPFTRLKSPPSSPAIVPPSLAFPLPDSDGPFLCTQGVGGHLTHFFPESYHAVDFRCPNGTPVLCAGDGVVLSLELEHKCSGIHCGNLQVWNAVTIRLHCGVNVEYLHVAAGSSRVKVGDVVHRGQVLCETGDIGFAPEPHLHIEAHSSTDAEGPSLPLCFSTPGSCLSFVPVAGLWYDSTGQVHTT